MYGVLLKMSSCRVRLPQWFPLDAHFQVAVAQECGRALLNDVLRPQPRFQVLDEALHERHKVHRVADVTGHRFCKRHVPSHYADINPLIMQTMYLNDELDEGNMSSIYNRDYINLKHKCHIIINKYYSCKLLS